MPLYFKHVCDLLSAIEGIATRDPPYLPTVKHEKQRETLCRWFGTHKTTIAATPDLSLAVFSAILPTKRPDRVYNIQYSRLVGLLKRCLCLGVERQRMLDQWQIPGRGDLADCVERVLLKTDDPLTLALTMVTLEEVDAALAALASKSRFSGPKVREREVDNNIQTSLQNIFRRLHSNEAKWLTRMILKDFSCLDLRERVVFNAFDSRLPVAMEMYDEMEVAIREHQKMLQPENVAGVGDELNKIKLLKPQIGTKVGPPRWAKAKGGIKHAISMIDGKTMSIEQKHDGEYCQIHVDLGKMEESIQILSKIGKDSTVDREEVHDAIKQGLRIGRQDCQFYRNCILEGELLVWCERKDAILDFHKIRKHVARSGTFLGTAEDSQPHPWEHLMVVFYDVLLIDDDPVIHLRHDERRQHLRRLVQKVSGKSDVVWRQRIDFSKPEGPQQLVAVFAHALAQRWEGLVLKPANHPYFEANPPTRSRYPACWIKLKKDCIAGLGDTADLVAIGAAYDGKAATKSKISNLSWTHFFIACLTNKQDVVERGAKPSFLVFDCLHDSMRKEDIKSINQHGQFRAMAPDSDECLKSFQLSYAIIEPHSPKISVVFKDPFVLEIAGSGFEKTPNQKIFTLRFPRVLKIHWDRDWRESVALDELQSLAREARSIPQDKQALHQERQEWIEKLDQSTRGAEGKKLAWDDTEDEEEQLKVGKERRSLAPAALTPNQKARTHMPGSFVRIDTSEISSGEKQSRTEAVIKKSTSRKPVRNRESVNSLHRTCSSPPAAKKKQQEDDRTKAMECAIVSPQRTKTLASDPTPSTEKPAATSLTRPLQEVTNSARPTQKPRQSTSSESHHTTPTTNFNLVRKLPASAGVFIRRRHHPPRRSTKNLSTTPSQTTSESASPTSQPPPTTTPPSSSPPPLPLPNPLTTHPLIIPAHLPHLLPLLPLPHHRLPFPPTTTHPDHDHHLLPLFLINTHPPLLPQTTHALHTLALHLPAYHPRPVQIWDWRILQHNNNNAGLPAAAEEWYVGAMGLEIGEGKTGEVVVVRWADGGETRVRWGEVEGVVDAGVAAGAGAGIWDRAEEEEEEEEEEGVVVEVEKGR